MAELRSDARAWLSSPEERGSVGLWNHYVRPQGESSTSGSKRSTSSHRTRQSDTQLPTAADLFVPSLPGVENLATHPQHPINLYAGLLPSDPGEAGGGGEGETGRDAELYFLLVKARRSAGRQRVVFWFNGGPGCSSFDGALMEVGPFRTVPASQTESGQVELRLTEGGWEEFANVVFIDQPPGTGFSYIPTNGYLHELEQGSQHLITFLDNFYKIFPELQGLDTYLAGESFAGQYIPYFAHSLLQTSALPDFNLKGIAIGNGWIDPLRQYPAYAHFAYEKGLLTEGSAEAQVLEDRLKACMSAMEQYTDPMNTPVNIDQCQLVMDAVMDAFVQEIDGKKVCMNVYDIRLTDEWPACGMNWPPDLTEVYDFLRRDDVIRDLHAEKKDTAWTECNGRVGAELRLHSSTAAVAYLPGILESGVEVLMFVGAEDLICNYKGIEEMIENMAWSGGKGFGNSSFADWSLNGTKVGTWATTRNLTYAKLFDSSHMPGYDVPHATNDMITRFMGVDFNLLPGILASTKSKIGSVNRVAIGLAGSTPAGMALLKGGDTDWDAWYNAASAFLILAILLGIVALYFYFRRKGQIRRRMGVGLPLHDPMERVPLGSERVEMDDIERAEEYEIDDHGRKRRYRSRGTKGKSKGDGMNGLNGHAQEDDHGETVFALGDDDEDTK